MQMLCIFYKNERKSELQHKGRCCVWWL